MTTDRDEEPRQPFPKLTGRKASEMGTERVRAHQRARLMGAMVAAVDGEGYAAVTVESLVATAGVSKSVFYREFADREACFIATFEEIVDLGAREIEAAYGSAVGAPERLEAAFEAFLGLATEAGPAGRLVFIASLDVGAAGLAARERAAERFQQLLAQSFAEEEGEEVSDLVVRGLVGGAHEVVYRRLRDGEPERLRDEVGALLRWGLGYKRERSNPLKSIGARLLAELDSHGAGPWTEPDEEFWDWEVAVDTDSARAALSQRERIMRATAQLAVEQGYLGLSVSAISTRAGTSNQTFYQNFETKLDAFLAAFDALGLRSFQLIAAAFQSQEGRILAGAAGMMAMLGHLASDHIHSRLVFIELSVAGRPARERAEAMLEVFISFIDPETLPPEVVGRPPRVVLEAIGGGIWTIVRQEIIAGREDSLPKQAAELIDFALLPFGAQ